MIVRYGRSVPKGFLTVYSVDTEQEAEELLSRTCEKVTYGPDYQIGYLAQELEHTQSLDNLWSFGRRLHKEYQKMKEEKDAPNQ